ncbi:MAG TPA: hypothetical protein VNG93_11360 [Candidatus Dormibacteraeota bacterium]|nr:hypothetical protein [Candidatus Dormibacteraeota bacterium]
MARKQKRKGPKAKVRQPLAPPAVQSTVAGASLAPRGGRFGGDQALVRSVEMSLGGTQAVVRGKGRNRVFEPMGTPGIPLDRVPYFTHDLRQIAIIGGLMLVLLVIANFTVIPLFVK